MHILFISQYFPPEIEIGGNKIFEVSKQLINLGHQVTVITGFPNYPTGIIPQEYRGKIFQKESQDGITVLRSYIYPSHDDRLLHRLLNQISFAISASIFSLFRISSVDVVIPTSPPLLVGIPGYLVSLFKKIPLIFEVRDLLPESAVAMGIMKNKQLIYFSSLIASFLYKKSNYLIALTEGIRQGLIKVGVQEDKIEVITNGADTDFFYPLDYSRFRSEHNLDNYFVILYTGTFGFIHGFETIIKAACLLKENSENKIVFVLVGDGAKRNLLNRAIKQNNLKNLKIISPKPRLQMPDIIAAADVCIATTHRSEIARGYIPSKMFEYMACAKPIILGIDGEAENIIKKSESGLCVGTENPQGIVNAILELRDNISLRKQLGENGRRIVGKQYSRDSISIHYNKLISKVLRRC